MPQHDLTLDNASGAAFRADANNALAALGSGMKGPNAPSNPLAGMIWVDDDTPSASIWTVKQYDGAEWIEVGRLDITNNVYIPSEGVIAWADVASAATVDLGAQSSRNLRITGSTTITSFGTAASGMRRELRFAAALTLTHNATSLILPGGANIVTAAGDAATAISLGSGNWVVIAFQRAAAFGIIRSAEIATNSGTAIDFTGIPSGVRRVTLLLNDVSTNGTSRVQVQLGAGSIQTSGYLGSGGAILGANAAAVVGSGAGTSGFLIEIANASAFRSGVMTFYNLALNKWVASYSMGDSNATANVGGGVVTLSGVLDRVRLTTVNGSDLFDSGTASITWEF